MSSVDVGFDGVVPLGGVGDVGSSSVEPSSRVWSGVSPVCVSSSVWPELASGSEGSVGFPGGAGGVPLVAGDVVAASGEDSSGRADEPSLVEQARAGKQTANNQTRGDSDVKRVMVSTLHSSSAAFERVARVGAPTARSRECYSRSRLCWQFDPAKSSWLRRCGARARYPPGSTLSVRSGARGVVSMLKPQTGR